VGAGGLLDEAAQRIAELEADIVKIEANADYHAEKNDELMGRVNQLEAVLREVKALADQLDADALKAVPEDYSGSLRLRYLTHKYLSLDCSARGWSDAADELRAILAKEEGK
jgi:hypothetical protein